MKLSIIYFSKTGSTKEKAEEIAQGMQRVANTEVRIFSLDEIDVDFINASSAVVFGTPTYCANMAWQLKKFLDESVTNGLKLGGKLGAAFATAFYVQGGADTAIQSIISQILVLGMLAYSSGGHLGQPFIHLGAVAVKDNFAQSKPLFNTFGERIAQKASELFAK